MRGHNLQLVSPRGQQEHQLNVVKIGQTENLPMPNLAQSKRVATQYPQHSNCCTLLPQLVLFLLFVQPVLQEKASSQDKTNISALRSAPR